MFKNQYIEHKTKYSYLKNWMSGGASSIKERLLEYSKQMYREITDAHQELIIREPIKLGEQDALLAIDVQYDFLPQGKHQLEKMGEFAVDEGDEIVDGIKRLMRRFSKSNSQIILTRDYHPKEHVSFGPFPDHCVVGTKGSEIVKPIAESTKYLCKTGNINVAIKGFFKDIDSYGAVKYGEDYAKTGNDGNSRLFGCDNDNGCNIDHTGSFIVNDLNLIDAATKRDIPNYKSYAKKENRLENYLIKRNIKRIFICGLAGDYCVLDTGVNLKQFFGDMVEVYMVFNRIRFAFVDGKFLTPPSNVLEKYKKNGIKLCWSSCLQSSDIPCEGEKIMTKKCENFFSQDFDK